MLSLSSTVHDHCCWRPRNLVVETGEDTVRLGICDMDTSAVEACAECNGFSAAACAPDALHAAAKRTVRR